MVHDLDQNALLIRIIGFDLRIISDRSFYLYVLSGKYYGRNCDIYTCFTNTEVKSKILLGVAVRLCKARNN